MQFRRLMLRASKRFDSSPTQPPTQNLLTSKISSSSMRPPQQGSTLTKLRQGHVRLAEAKRRGNPKGVVREPMNLKFHVGLVSWAITIFFPVYVG